MDLAKLRARMSKRNVAGTKLPRQDRTSVFLENELKRAGKTGYAGESGVVEGGAARPRLDRPARAAGGRVMKADDKQGAVKTKFTVNREQDHEDRTEKPDEDKQYKGRDSEKKDGARDAFEHRNDDGPKGGEKKTEHWAKGGRVVYDHEDHGHKRKKAALEKHDRLKNHTHEETCYHGTGDGEHEELFAKGGAIHGRRYDHSGGHEDKEEVLHRHDRLKNHTHESSHYDKEGWDGGPYGKGFSRHKAEMHHGMPGQKHPTGKAHGGSVKASDDYDGHGHFKGRGFEHKHKAQLYADGGRAFDKDEQHEPRRHGGSSPPPHPQAPPREKNEVVGRDRGGLPPMPNPSGGGDTPFSKQPKDPGRPVAADKPHAHGGPVEIHHHHNEHHHHLHHAGGGPAFGNLPHAHPDPYSGGMKGNMPHADGGASHGPVQPNKMPPPHVSRNSGGVPDSDNRSISREGRMEGPVHRKDGGSGEKKWIQHAVPASHKGRLHKALGVPEGEKIPEKKLEKAEHSENPHMQHMAQFAERMKGLKK